MKYYRTLGANTEYINQTKLYNKKDALLALLLYVVMTLTFILMGKHFIQKSTLTEPYIFCFTGIISLVCISIVLSICFIRKQQLITVGFSKTNAKKSFILGTILLLIIVILKVIIPVVNGSVTIRTDLGQILMNIVYYLIFIAFMEELVFRGFIGTRLFGYFRNKLFSIIVVGILFAVLHIPFQMIVAQVSFSQYISDNMGILVNIFFWHFIKQWLYARYNSIIAPTMLHFIMDFIGWFII